MTELTTAAGAELALIDTKSANAERLKAFALEARHHIDTMTEDELDQLEALLVAVGKRLKQLGKDASEAERTRVMTLVRIGELLGKAQRGGDRRSEEFKSEKQDLKPAEKNRRHTARLLAEFEALVKEELAKDKPISLSRLIKICQRKRSGDSEIDLPMPTRTYSILYADPPWRYEHASSAVRQIENQYGTMPLESIKNLAVPAAEDAVLFCWATSPKLAECLEVVDAWGFDYRTCLVWVKDKIGMGYYARQQHELLLVAARGALPTPAPEHRPSSVFYGDRTEHSAKPALVYELIENMYSEYNREPGNTEFLELFSRQPRSGWDAWGNEA